MECLGCAVIGAGPAGLNAGLVLGRARKQIALFDNKMNRNRVTGRTSEKKYLLSRRNNDSRAILINYCCITWE